MRNPFWLNRNPYHCRVICVLADLLDTIIAVGTLGIVGSSFGFTAIATVTKWQIEEKIKEEIMPPKHCR